MEGWNVVASCDGASVIADVDGSGRCGRAFKIYHQHDERRLPAFASPAVWPLSTCRAELKQSLERALAYEGRAKPEPWNIVAELDYSWGDGDGDDDVVVIVAWPDLTL